MKMTEQNATLTRHDLEAKIVKHCWEDDEFRGEFIADPAGAFVKYLEVPPENLPKIVVHEETPGSWHIVLLPSPRNIGELSEQDLERIAGGSDDDFWLNDPLHPDYLENQRLAKLSLVSKVGSAVSAVIASGIGSLIAGQNIDTGW
jgi:hypothetical protein